MLQFANHENKRLKKIWDDFVDISHLELEQRQYKNDSILSKIIPILKLARFYTNYTGREKVRQIQNWNYF